MNKEILRLAIPNILSNISVPLLSSVDTALMGNVSALHLGAIGLGAMIFNFIFWNFGFLRMGTTGMTAQAFGASDHKEISLIFYRALLLGILIGGLIIIFQRPLLESASWLLQVSGEQESIVFTYFSIRILAAPATLSLFVLMGWFFGMQNSIYPLILTIFINLVNIGLSYYLVVDVGLNIRGVAWGTVAAQYAGLLFAGIIVKLKYQQYFKLLSFKEILNWEAMSRFLVINRDIFIRTFFLTISFGTFYSLSSGYGELVLAVNVILMQFINWMSYGVDGFAYAAESLVGKYYGSKDEKGLATSINLSFIWGLILSIIYTLLFYLGWNFLMEIFTDDPEVILAAGPYKIWIILFPILATPCYIWDGIFIGLTASRAMRDCMLLAFLVYILSIFLSENWLQGANHGLWISLIVFMVLRGMFQWLWFKRADLALFSRY